MPLLAYFAAADTDRVRCGVIKLKRRFAIVGAESRNLKGKRQGAKHHQWGGQEPAGLLPDGALAFEGIPGPLSLLFLSPSAVSYSVGLKTVPGQFSASTSVVVFE
jgi:hypothetical protein